MKNLHIQDTDKFIESYIEFVNKHFNQKSHLFAVLHKNKNERFNNEYDNIQYLNYKLSDFLLLIMFMYKAEKIFLHGLFNNKVVLLLFIQPWLLRKCNWVMWGGDLYRFKKRKNRFKSNVYEVIRKAVISNFGGLITQVKGDYELAKKWYGVKGKHYYSFMYPSNLYKQYDFPLVNKDIEEIHIQVGNSADPTNNHIEVFDLLKQLKVKSFKIICPLSYPSSSENQKYKVRVIEEGKKLFGDRFIPLLEYISFEDYLELLSKIDIAIFNHDRQQALGNITTLLGLGKKIYIREEITTWNFAQDHNLKLYSINNNNNNNNLNFLEPITSSIRRKNIENIKKSFSESKLIEDLKKIFID